MIIHLLLLLLHAVAPHATCHTPTHRHVLLCSATCVTPLRADAHCVAHHWCCHCVTITGAAIRSLLLVLPLHHRCSCHCVTVAGAVILLLLVARQDEGSGYKDEGGGCKD